MTDPISSTAIAKGVKRVVDKGLKLAKEIWEKYRKHPDIIKDYAKYACFLTVFAQALESRESLLQCPSRDNTTVRDVRMHGGDQKHAYP